MIVKNKNSKKMKRLLIIALCIAFLSTLLFVGYNYSRQNSSDTEKVQDSESPTQGTPSQKEKTILAEPDKSIPVESDLEKPSITRAEQDSAGNIRVSAIFAQSTSGTCKIVFEKNGEPTITKSADIIVGPSYYACNGFSIAPTEFSIGGEWQLHIEHSLNDIISSTDKQSIVISKP